MADTEKVNKGNAIIEAAQKYNKYDEQFAKNDVQNTKALSDQEDAIGKERRKIDDDVTYDLLAEKGKQEKGIDDGWLYALPKGIYKMYKDGDLGDTSTTKGKKKAKATMGLLIAEEIANSLGKIGNSFAQMGGMNGVYNDRETTAQKINRTNIEQGLQNRWNKIKTSTDNALKLVMDNKISQQDAQSAISRLTANARMENEFNRLNEQQKAYAITVSSLIGKEIGSLDDKDFYNFIQGAIANGMDEKKAAEMYILKFGNKIMDADGDNLIEKGKNALEEMGLPVTTGIKNALPEQSSNNVIKFSDGSEIDVGTYATKNDFNKLNAKSVELEQKALDNYEDKEIFQSVMEDYSKLYEEWQKHPIANRNKGIGAGGTFLTPEEFAESIKNRKELYYADLNKVSEIKAKYGKDSKQYKKAKKDFDKKYNIK